MNYRLKKDERVKLLKKFNDFVKEEGGEGLIKFYVEEFGRIKCWWMFEELEEFGFRERLRKLERFMRGLVKRWNGDDEYYIKVECLECNGEKGNEKCERCGGEGYEILRNSRFGDLEKGCRERYYEMGQRYYLNIGGVRKEVEDYLNNIE